MTTGITSGTGDATVQYTIDETNISSSRVGEITAVGDTIFITQLGITCEVTSLSPTNLTNNFSENTGLTFNITMSAQDCSWEATTSEDWIILQSTTGSGDSTITYRITENILNASRTGQISIGGFTHTITQSGITCEILDISPDNYTAAYTTGSGSFNVNMSAEDCPWSATTDDDWITLGATSGTGDATITYDISENELNATRIAEISIGGFTHTVTQTGIECETVSIYPFKKTFNPTSQSGITFSINMSAEDCPWGATTDDDWITLGATSGTGDATITYNITENILNASRTGQISIGGLTYEITQLGVACEILDISPDTYSVESSGATGLSFDIVLNASDCQWQITTSNDWITIEGATFGSGDASFTYNISENILNAPRFGSIIIDYGPSTVIFSVSQTGVTCETIGLSSTSYSAGYTAESGVTFSIDMSAEDCEFGITTSANWIDLLGITNGSGDTTITYNIEENELNATRIAEISIGGLTHTITQTGVPCETIGLSSTSYSAGYTAESGVTFSIDMSAEDCPWLATKNASWITLYTTSGNGDSIVTYDIAENTSKFSRVANISIGGLTHTISQSGVVCEILDINPDNYSAGYTGHSGVTFNIDISAEDCSWSLSKNVDWITLYATSGNGDTTISYDIAENTLNATRTGEININGSSHIVTQIGVPCESLGITPDNYSAGYTAESGVTFSIDMSAEDCSWSATTDADWITLGATSGTGDATITYDISENTSSEGRTGEISIGGFTHTVSQNALLCEVIGISPKNRSKPSSGGTSSFGVSMSNQGCTWIATESESWITLDVSSGTGDGYVEYTVDSNSSETQRIGEISIGGFTHTITQSGSTCEVLLLDPSFDTIDSDGGTLGITIDMSDDACSWGATTDEAWITLGVTSGTGDDRLEYFVSENTTIVDRYGEIYVNSDTNGLTHGITQFGAICSIISIDPISYNASSSGSTNSFGVSMSNQGCTWIATESESWITLDVSSGTGDGYVEYTVDSNPLSVDRAGEIVVGEFSHTIVQNGVTCQIVDTTPSGYTAGYTGESGLTVFINMISNECAWTATTDEDWINIHTTSGIGDATINYDIAANPVDSGSRVGEIEINGLTFTVNQTGHVCETLSINPSTNSITRSGGTGSFVVDMSDDDCGWIATTEESWISINPASGNGDSTITYTITKNPVDSGDRVGEISIGGLTHTITQSGHTCETLSISSSANSFNQSGGTGSFDIDMNEGDCPWSSTTNVDWIKIDLSNGTGDATITYTVQENILNASRTGDISINGFTHSVSQTGVTCETLSINPTSLSFNSSGGTNSVDIDMSAEDCSWSATTDAAWITLGATSGTGDATIIYTVQENILNASRTGDINIGGLTHQVQQTGVTCSLVGITPDSFTLSEYTAGTGSFDIDMSAEDCGWSVTTEADWITLGVTSGTGDATVGYTFSENDLVVSRVGEISVGGLTHTVEQPPFICSVVSVEPIVSFSFNNSSLGYTGGTFETSITMNNDNCSWGITIDYISGDPENENFKNWISLSLTGGTGNQTIIYSITTNTTPLTRSAYVYLDGYTGPFGGGGSGAFQFIQQDSAPSSILSITPSSSVVGYTGISSDPDSRASFELDITDYTNFHATTNNDWITIHTLTWFGEFSPIPIYYSVEQNPFTYGRTGEILVSRVFEGGLSDDLVFEITQEGVGFCSVLSLTPIETHVGPSGGTGLEFDVKMNAQDCIWTTAVTETENEWLTLEPSSVTGMGDSTIVFGVTGNEEPGNDRVAIIRVAKASDGEIDDDTYIQGIDHYVFQDSVPCIVEQIIPPSLTGPPSNATNSFYVQVNAEGCHIESNTSDDWIEIINESTKGNRSIFYTVSENLSTQSRTGQILVDGLVHTFTQSGYDFKVVLDKYSDSSGAAGKTGEINLTTEGDGNLIWSVSSDQNWLQITSGITGTGDGTITYTVDENTKPKTRYGNINFSVAGSPDVVFVVSQSRAEIEKEVPQTPITKQPTNQNYIYPTYYKFVIKEMPQLEYFITKVTLPSFGYDSAIEQPNRFSLIRHPASKIVYAPLEMSFLVNEDMTNWLEISNWIRRTSVSDDHIDILDDTGEHFTQGTLFITNSAMNPNIEVTFYNMFPISVSGFEFDSQITDLTPWTANVTFAYDYYDIKKL